MALRLVNERWKEVSEMMEEQKIMRNVVKLINKYDGEFIERGKLIDSLITIKDVKLMIEKAYKKYVIPSTTNERMMVKIINYPISAMRAELLEQLEKEVKK